MKMDHLEIYAHDSETDIIHKINAMELQNWINHLSYIQLELRNFTHLYHTLLVEKALMGKERFQQFEAIMGDNDVILHQLQQLKDARISITDCLDILCDMSFIQEHEKCRKMFQFHINKYRKQKDLFFSELQERAIALGRQ